MLIPRWRNLSMLKNPFISSSKLASFHSTPLTCEKRKNNDVRKFQTQQPSKDHIRFAIRQKRADTKRALKDLLFNSGSLNSFQVEDPLGKFGFESEKADKKGRSKSSRNAAKPQPKKTKRKSRRDSYSEDDTDSETNYRAAFGKKWSTWSFGSFQSSTFEFQWRDQTKRSTNPRTREWDTASESESDDESCTVVGSGSDRTILGLPPTGPLKIEDVKNAFRASALKWHPDKHQGSSQVMAAEKFKLCVNAYKSLCNALARV